MRSPRDGDIGAVYGIGYPPFRGGPLRQLDDVGAARIVDTLEATGAGVWQSVCARSGVAADGQIQFAFLPDKDHWLMWHSS